jgi:RNA polymerase sigma-B factor
MEAAPATAVSPFRERRERELLCRYQRDGDLAARDALTRRFMPLARDLAKRYRHTGEPFEDVAQVAYVGLIKAIDRFKPHRGVRFRATRFRRSWASCGATCAMAAQLHRG